MEVRLPQAKLEQLTITLATWRGRKAGKKRDLLSLIGSLSHACKAVRAGRSFLRRLIDLSTGLDPATAVWGVHWKGKTIRAECDNAAVVACINSGTSHSQEAMHLRRCLAFIAANHNFHIFSSHVKGVDNVRADTLSRDNLELFMVLQPQANGTPTTIPPPLLDLLIVSKPDWTSQHWTQLWSSTFTMV